MLRLRALSKRKVAVYLLLVYRLFGRFLALLFKQLFFLCALCASVVTALDLDLCQKKPLSLPRQKYHLAITFIHSIML